MPETDIAETRKGDIEGDALGERVLGAARWARHRVDPLRLAVAKERARARMFAGPTDTVTVGRYVLVERIGHGGMGVVYSAYDPELDRKIALKVLYPDACGGTTEQDERLLREAQALAKLAHPNVVAIYDVGRVSDPELARPDDAPSGSSIFLAMEYVEGVTLSRWLGATRRSMRQIIDVMSDAARGLAAAHEQSLVHRDFKPDNVMVGDDGRVRVMDFGIARQLTAASSEGERPVPLSFDGSAPVSAGVTPSTLGILGTPAYMAPEQLRGEVVGEAADQFAFCVVLWEALYGERPFDGDTLITLATAVLEGKRRPVPRAAVPGWLRRIIDRGLAIDPARRWPSMTALLAELARARTRARWHGALALTLGIVTVGAAAQAYRAFDRQRKIAACATGAATIDEVWNDQARADVRAGVLATGLGYAATTADNAITWLDERAKGWAAHRTEACMNASVDELWDTATSERVLWCLDERRVELASVVSMFVAADAGVVSSAVSTAARLPDSARCVAADEVALLPPAPTDAQRAAALEVRTEIARASALRAAGRYADGLAILRDARARSEGFDSPRWLAMIFALEGALLSGSGAYPEAEVASLSAYMAAASAEAWDIAADAANNLVYSVGHGQKRFAEAHEWARHAETAATLAGDPLGLWAARRARMLAVVEGDAGEYAAAKEHHERSIEVLERVLGPEHPDVASGLGNLAIVLSATGDYPRAIETGERALAIFEQTYGTDHPLVNNARNNLAIDLHRAGRSAEALALYDEVLAVRERTNGADHPATADTLTNIGAIQADLGDYPAAKATQERALAIRERALGRDDASLGMTIANLAVVHFNLGEYAQAEALHERALAIEQTSLPPDHPDIASSWSGLANAQFELGKHEKARISATRALASHEKALGVDHPLVAVDLANLAIIELARNDTDAAIALFERAMAIYDAIDGVQANEPLAAFGLARALVASGGDHARALALARRAREAYDSEGDRHVVQVARIERWLGEHADDDDDP